MVLLYIYCMCVLVRFSHPTTQLFKLVDLYLFMYTLVHSVCLCGGGERMLKWGLCTAHTLSLMRNLHQNYLLWKPQTLSILYGNIHSLFSYTFSIWCLRWYMENYELNFICKQRVYATNVYHKCNVWLGRCASWSLLRHYEYRCESEIVLWTRMHAGWTRIHKKSMQYWFFKTCLQQLTARQSIFVVAGAAHDGWISCYRRCKQCIIYHSKHIAWWCASVNKWILIWISVPKIAGTITFNRPDQYSENVYSPDCAAFVAKYCNLLLRIMGQREGSGKHYIF